MEVEEQIAQALRQSSLPADVISHIQSSMANKEGFDVSQPEGIVGLQTWLERNISQSHISQDIITTLKNQLEIWKPQHSSTVPESHPDVEPSTLDVTHTSSGTNSRHSSVSTESEHEDFVAAEEAEIHMPIPINLYDQSNYSSIFFSYLRENIIFLKPNQTKPNQTKPNQTKPKHNIREMDSALIFGKSRFI
jgi:hypothetical protein